MHLRRPTVPDVRLTNEEIADLHNALDMPASGVRRA